MSYFVGAIMAIGATLGAVNSLYAMVDSRQREFATLRAIGFKSGPVILAVLLESMLLALPGALLGCLLAWTLFNGLCGESVGLQLSTFGYAAARPARHRMGVSDGIAGRTAARADALPECRC